MTVLPPLFHAPPDCREGDKIVLPPEEARHAAQVLRLKAGSLVIVVDGLGRACRAEIVSLGRKKVLVRVHSEIRDFGEPAVRLTLAAGLSTGTKFDSVVQRGTELGVSRFVPLLTEKSKVTLEDPRRAKAKVIRWRKVARAAMKQCRRSYVPEVAMPTALPEFLEQHDPDGSGLIFHPDSKAELLSEITLDADAKRMALLVGPESGFSEDEVRLARKSGFLPVSLGRRILRSETAGPVVAALVFARLGEFR